MYGLKNFVISVANDLGVAVTPTNVAILNAATQTASTVYADEQLTSLTNPITAPASNVISFWSAASTHDIKIATASGRILMRTITPYTHQAVVATNLNKNQLLYALPDAGTSLVGNVVDQTRTASASFTIPADTLKEGDVVHVHAVMRATAQSGTITQLYDIAFGAAITSNTLAAGDATNVAAEDLWMADLYITIRSATTAMVTGQYCKTPAALATAVTKPYWVAAITIATTTAIICAVCNTFEAASLAGDTCQAEQFIVEVKRA